MAHMAYSNAFSSLRPNILFSEARLGNSKAKAEASSIFLLSFLILW